MSIVTWFDVWCPQCLTVQPCNQYGRVKWHQSCGYVTYDFNPKPKRIILRCDYTEKERW